MISAQEYLNNLDRKSVWIFTKQKCDFDEAVKSAKLFDSIPNREETNIEEFFTAHHAEYGVETDRHRTLVMPQFFGMITKTPFYKRGGNYNKEKPTAVYEKFNAALDSANDFLYNKLKTEQMLKLKVHAIIDTADNNEDYHILPIVFIYKVLKELQLQHDISSITIDQLYTYVMTCKEYKQWEQAVEYIKNNEPISKYVGDYKSLSRIETLIKNNIKLFLFDGDNISINPTYDEYFYETFLMKYDIDEMNEILYRDVDYSYFLYNYQGFDINLIDDPCFEPSAKIEVSRKEIIKTEELEETENDDNYNEKIDSINENNVNIDVAIGAHSIAPVVGAAKEISKKYKRNPLLGRIAIQHAYYCCEKDAKHETFISAKTKKSFMEAHHLVPVKYQKEIWAKYGINVDCVENIVSLCPTCHRAFHNGTKEVKAEMIEKIFNHLIPRYKSIKFDITLEEVKKLYHVN